MVNRVPRQKKNGKHISLILDQKLYDDLEKYCDATYLTKTATIEKALHALFYENGKLGEGDMLLFSNSKRNKQG